MRASGCASARLVVSVPAIPPRTWKLKWTAEASVRDTRGRFVRAVDDPLQIAGHRHRFMHRGNAGFSAPRECAPSIMSGLHHRLSNRDGGEVVFDAMHVKPASMERPPRSESACESSEGWERSLCMTCVRS